MSDPSLLEEHHSALMYTAHIYATTPLAFQQCTVLVVQVVQLLIKQLMKNFRTH